MWPLLSHPLAFLGLLSLPALAGIYWLRSRFRRYPVSTLLLWRAELRTRQGGIVIDRLQMPILFALELAALFGLTVAAVDARFASTEAFHALYVVLDDSYSMLAGGPGSPRNRAVRALEAEVVRRSYDAVHFIAAGARPRLLGHISKH